MNNHYNIFPLGDAAATIDLGNVIDERLNKKTVAMQDWFRVHPFHGLKDVIVAYSSLTIVYDAIVVKEKYHPAGLIFDWAKALLEKAFNESVISSVNNSPVVTIPVCYDEIFGPDLAKMSEEKGISKEEIIRLHTSKLYRVYMVGFLPGFPYMASVHEKLVTPRKARPVMVAPGSVGIAGAQTGIYPFNSPGGWNIIGRTNIKLFDPCATTMVTLKTGDTVQFYAISRQEFETAV